MQDVLRKCGEQQRHFAKQKQRLENLTEQVEAQRARQVRHPSQQNLARVACLEARIAATPPSDDHLRRALTRAAVPVSDARAGRVACAALLTRCVALVCGSGMTTFSRRCGCSHLRLLSLRTCSVRETEILVEQQPPQGVLVCDHAGLVINKFSLTG